MVQYIASAYPSNKYITLVAPSLQLRLSKYPLAQPQLAYSCLLWRRLASSKIIHVCNPYVRTQELFRFRPMLHHHAASHLARRASCSHIVIFSSSPALSPSWIGRGALRLMFDARHFAKTGGGGHAAKVGPTLIWSSQKFELSYMTSSKSASRLFEALEAEAVRLRISPLRLLQTLRVASPLAVSVQLDNLVTLVQSPTTNRMCDVSRVPVIWKRISPSRLRRSVITAVFGQFWDSRKSTALLEKESVASRDLATSLSLPIFCGVAAHILATRSDLGAPSL
ncbi:uncharacterized protein K489DRAFT_34026 [Dissoconium aciculare CBS 342.82]|uniref:Uncharacterized protein n=1 Tax=Dissoconium aciculare CBS 342.82 TaxID=1314786 RepID=A0A6J3LXL6_9PEZI|nr:uncharacterized protein K489DRAFT_34026 [Dissoconium aciculare CBS 342.82]KAF1820495.1 hypothetical protein K489DRAFT_34026 [Dissoconium aciculare CBS 342.82]